MTGPVDWTTLIAIVTGLLAVGGFGVWFAWWLAGTLAEQRHNIRNEVHAQINSLEEDHSRKIGAIDDQLRTFRLEVATNYASKTGVAAGLDRVVDEIKGLRIDMKEGLSGLRAEIKDDIGGLGERVQRMEDHALGRA